MSAARLFARSGHGRGLDMNLERELNSIRQECGKWPVETLPGGMAQLMEENGERGPIVTRQFACYFVTMNPERKYEIL